jgi:Sulfotransferase domain
VTAPIRIAMWSGPRNLSTAMMRAFGNRPDTTVVDEPFYAAYLAGTGIDHPLRAEVLAACETDPDRIAQALAGPVPGGAAIFYQKHMTHHMLDGFDLRWMELCRHAFLIRAPERVLASYAARRAEVELADIGFVRQAELFDQVSTRDGRAPPVIDAEDVLADPARTLTALCATLDIAFDPAMLAWPAGRRATDGVWAPAWYQAVERSTGFGRPSERPVKLAPGLEAIAAKARPYYERLARHRI